MKLSYQIKKESALEIEMIKFKIISQIKESDYKVEQIRGETVRFNNSGWELRSNASQVGKVNGGVFEVLVLEDKRIITLTYYINFTYNLVLLAIFLLLSFWLGYGSLFAASGLIFFSLISIPIAKTKCEEMLERIAGDL